LEWDGWTAPAKAYIGAAGDHLDIHTFVEDYLERVLRFHKWLDTALQQFHAADLAQLKAMQDAYARLSGKDPAFASSSEPKGIQGASPTSDEPSIVLPFEFSHDIAAMIDEGG
jgi:hypothetical protein